MKIQLILSALCVTVAVVTCSVQSSRDASAVHSNQTLNPSQPKIGYLRVLVRSGDQGQNPPIVGAEVRIEEVAKKVVTNANGHATAIRLPTDAQHPLKRDTNIGVYTVVVSKPGFKRHTYKQVIVWGGSTEADPTTMDVYLIPGEGEATFVQTVGGRTERQSP